MFSSEDETSKKRKIQRQSALKLAQKNTEHGVKAQTKNHNEHWLREINTFHKNNDFSFWISATNRIK